MALTLAGLDLAVIVETALAVVGQTPAAVAGAAQGTVALARAAVAVPVQGAAVEAVPVVGVALIDTPVVFQKSHSQLFGRAIVAVENTSRCCSTIYGTLSLWHQVRHALVQPNFVASSQIPKG